MLLKNRVFSIYPASFLSTRLFIAALAILTLTSCVIADINKQSKIINQTSIISGEVAVAEQYPFDVRVLLFKVGDGYVRRVGEYQLGKDKQYQFHVDEGLYAVGAFVDVNDDDIFQRSEPANYIGYQGDAEVIYLVAANSTVELPLLNIDGHITSPQRPDVVSDLSKSMQNIGAIAQLDNDIFTLSNAGLGMWKPVEFTEKFGAGLYRLSPRIKGRIPIVFVHGIMGSPVNFKSLIGAVDQSKYEPWVLHYASGSRLDMVSSYLLTAMNRLEDEFEYERFIVVAHSMGGLVALDFANKYQHRGGKAKLAMLMTINTPYDGLSSAAAAIKHSPIVIPAWQDVANGSEFLTHVQKINLSEELPFYLLFTYQSGQDGDGTVTLASQLQRMVQDKASAIKGFQGSHSGVLSDSALIDEVLSTIAMNE